MTISLNANSRTSIEKITGIPFKDFLEMDIDSIEAIVEKK